MNVGMHGLRSTYIVARVNNDVMPRRGFVEVASFASVDGFVFVFVSFSYDDVAVFFYLYCDDRRALYKIINGQVLGHRCR